MLLLLLLLGRFGRLTHTALQRQTGENRMLDTIFEHDRVSAKLRSTLHSQRSFHSDDTDVFSQNRQLPSKSSGLTDELLLAVLVTAMCRCLRLCGGVVLAMEGGGDTLSLLTGVGGALSARGRDIPTYKKKRVKNGGGGLFCSSKKSEETKMICLQEGQVNQTLFHSFACRTFVRNKPPIISVIHLDLNLQDFSASFCCCLV